MSINNLFEKGNKYFLLQNHIEGLEIYKEIWLKYPKNTRLDEEIKKKVKKFKISIQPSFLQNQINEFFELHNVGKTNSVIQTLYNFLKNNRAASSSCIYSSVYVLSHRCLGVAP